MTEKKEIKCYFCGKTFNITDLIIKTETTDIFLGLNWGIPSWEEYEVGYCPDCRYPLMRNNKKIEYQEYQKKEEIKNEQRKMEKL